VNNSTPSIVRDALQRAALPPQEAASHALAEYLQTLAKANTRLSLTAIQDPETLLERFVIEPLIGWRHILDLLRTAPPPGQSLIDVGSGGGAPGLPIAITEPTWDVTLVESRRRKAEFLQATAQQLDLARTTAVQSRIETVAHGPTRETFGVAIARAVAPLPVTLELLLPLVAIGGLAAVWSGPSARSQFHLTEQFAQAAGGATPQATALTWPNSDRTLILVTTRKLKASPKPYPRTMQRIRSTLARAAKAPSRGHRTSR
jgi:16S rRNA (guanine527-N7)-methyltransferase